MANYVKIIPQKNQFNESSKDDKLLMITTTAPDSSGDNDDAIEAINSLIAENPDSVRLASGAASIAIQTPEEDNASAILYHDDFSGDTATYTAAAQTRTVNPGPGTMTVGDADGLIRYENGECILGIEGTLSGASRTIIRAPGQTIVDGLTMIVRFVPGFERGGYGRQTDVGFSSATTSSSPSRGMIRVGQSTGDAHATVSISQLTNSSDTNFFMAARGIVKEGQEVAVAIKHVTTSHQQYWMQGGELTSYGAILGSDEWVMLGETFADLSGSLTGNPMVCNQVIGETRVRSMQVLSNWSPSKRHIYLDYNRVDLGTHIPCLEKDPTTGLVVAAWNRGLTHTSIDKVFRASVRLADNTWTAPETIQAAGFDSDYQTIHSLSKVGSELWLIYAAQPSEGVGGTLKKRVVTVNSATGAITLGSSTDLGVSGTDNLAFNPILTLSTGRLVLPYHKTAGGITYLAYSDNGGNTWISDVVVANGSTTTRIEATAVEESDGAIGVYMRTNNGATYYARSTDGGETFNSEKAIYSIPQPTDQNGNRLHARRLSDGKIILVGTDHAITRRNLTIWRVGDNGVVLGKMRIGDWNPETATNGTSVQQYPVFIEDGEDLLIAHSRQPSAVGTAGIGIQIDNVRWAEPVSIHAGGTGRKDVWPAIISRPRNKGIFLTYGTAPVPDMGLGDLFYITLTASTAVIGAPTNATPWQPLTIVFIQGGAGSFTATFNAAFEFGNITPVWLTAVNATNTLKGYWNPVTKKLVVTSFT